MTASTYLRIKIKLDLVDEFRLSGDFRYTLNQP